jgi:hypothetical protein
MWVWVAAGHWPVNTCAHPNSQSSHPCVSTNPLWLIPATQGWPGFVDQERRHGLISCSNQKLIEDLGGGDRGSARAPDTGTSLTAANDFSVRQALKAAGVEFIDENGGGPGVRLRKSAHERTRR